MLALLAIGCPASAQVSVLDDFEDLDDWRAVPSAGATLAIASDSGHSGRSMRLDFDFHGGGGYVTVHKALAVDPPANYVFTFRIRGQAPANRLEFKLVDRSGQNVWWYRQRDFAFPADWQQVTIRKRRIEPAWGPDAAGGPKHVASVEFAITAGAGGKGSVWIDDLRLEARAAPAESERPPLVHTSSATEGGQPGRILDGQPDTAWHSTAAPERQWVQIDFGAPREYGGLVIDWDTADYATAYDVQVSDDGAAWSTVHRCAAGNGGRDYVYMPDADSRLLRVELVRSSRGSGYGIRSIDVRPFEFSASPNQFFEAMARDAPPGLYPKYFSGQQTYWTIVGVSGGSRKALLNEEGALEVDYGGPAIEPFLYLDGELVSWAQAQTTPGLEDGYAPMPTVTWRHPRVSLTISAFGAGVGDQSAAYVGYRVENPLDRPQDVTLFLAIRPFQVTPPWQSLNLVGGVSPIRDLRFDAPTVSVNGDRAVIALTPPDRFGAVAFSDGGVTDYLGSGRVPPQTHVSDAAGWASGALAYALRLAPRATADVHLAVPLQDAGAVLSAVTKTSDSAALVSDLRARERTWWKDTLNRVDFELPPAAGDVARTLKSTLAYLLLNRSGAAIQPGPRNYARSWIRDGAMSSQALLALGCPEPVRDFLGWYAQYQTPEGRVPCCVDQRGADPVPEHDSNGEFLFAVAEYYRYTRDIGFVYDMWPAVVRAVDYLDGLRRQRLAPAYEQPEQRAFYGLLPESISHEGYSSKPMHSYWDDFWALRGFKDAAMLAVTVGDDANATRFATLRDAFRRDLFASLDRTIAAHRIDFLPGSVELGDFDPTSTAAAVMPGGELEHLPRAALLRTFERYYTGVRERLQRFGTDEAYSPYEARTVGVLVRLGQRERAQLLLESLLADRRPLAWNQWAEVVWRVPSAPRFVGDMPHTWVGSSFVNSVRSMLVYEREADGALVIAAGLPAAWVTDPAGVTVRRVPTHFGVLNYSIRPEGPRTLRVRLGGDVVAPAGRFVLVPPLPSALRRVEVNGVAVDTFTATEAVITRFPADVVLEY